MTTILFLLLCGGTGDIGSPVPRPPQAPPVRELWGDYSFARAKAERTRTPLVVYVGHRRTWQQLIGDADTVEVESLEGFPSRCIVPCAVVDGKLSYRDILPVGADAETIRGALRRVAVPVMAQPTIQSYVQPTMRMPANCTT